MKSSGELPGYWELGDLFRFGFDVPSHVMQAGAMVDWMLKELNALSTEEIATRSFLIVADPGVGDKSPLLRVMRQACQDRGLDVPRANPTHC